MAYVAITGASGYTGQETLDRVLAHPALELVALGSDSLAGRPATALDPRLGRNGARLPAFVTNEEALSSGADVTFVCLGHEEATRVDAPARGVVVDLSGAHRLREPAAYAEWYGFTHPRPATLADWTYAVPELFPPEGPLVANPGCYATAVVLALAPLAEVLDAESVAVDGKSGISGAGRALKPSSHAGQVLENAVPYRVGRHQHVPEIAQVLGFPVALVTTVLPVRRGLIVTCFARAAESERDLRARLDAAYARSPAVTVLSEDAVPDLARVQGTDAAEIGIFTDRATGRTIVICALDNLGKGAAGQAIQNANLAIGYPETAGLRLDGVLV